MDPQASERPRRTIGEILTEGLGVSVAEASRLVSGAGWNTERLVEEFRSEGWQVRLRVAAAEAEALSIEKEVTRSLVSLVRSGPAAAAAKSHAELLAMIKAPKLREFAEGYDPAIHGGRLIMAPTGVGKSIACLVAVRRRFMARAVENRRRVSTGESIEWDPRKMPPATHLWTRAFDLANARLEHALGDGEASATREASRCGFLVLDDVGWESRRAGADDAVLEVIAARYDAGLVTCATTGLRMDQFIERYGEAVMRRLVEAGGPGGKVLDLWPRENKQ